MDVLRAFYDRHPYPPPRDDLEAYRRQWNDARRRADFRLFWPAEPYRDDLSILIAGCGTMQAAHYAIRWPRARVTGIDVSAQSLSFTGGLKRRYGLENLALRELAIEDAAELGQKFDYIVCTGVLHHLADPDAGLKALREILEPKGAMHLMLYAPYGRAGIYMLQEYCRRIGIEPSDGDVRELAASLRALPRDHPIAPLLRNSPDFSSIEGLADALLHPRDRAYSVPQLMEFLDRAGLEFGRWIRQAPYLPWCGAPAATPHKSKLAALPSRDQYATLELFRGSMVRHSFVARREDAPNRDCDVDFLGDEWPEYIPIRLPETIVVRDPLPAGATAVLINRNHTYSDLYLPVDERKERLFAAIDGKRSIAQICDAGAGRAFARDFFLELWRWDQVVFDTGAARLVKE